MSDIEFVNIQPHMLVHPYIVELPPAPPDDLPLSAEIMRAANIPGLWDRLAACTAIAAKVQRMERILDRIVAAAQEEQRAIRAASNVVPFPGRMK